MINYASKGYTHKKISKLTDFSISRVSDLVRVCRQYVKNGIGYSIVEHRKGSNRRNMTPQQEEQIINEFTEKAINGQVVSLTEMKK